ncbi:MAG: DUF819 family protein [Sulfurovaceae bacterium]|nr:DUF819 family protein [Sulfurovaceae bacterium]
MIENSFHYIAILIMIIGSIVWIEKKYPFKIFHILPSIVIVYAFVMLIATLGIWGKSENIEKTYNTFKDALLPAMIFLMLLNADMRSIAKLGKKMIFTFLLATLSIMLGFIVSFGIFHNLLAENSWMGFAALSGSWIGGTGNMMAIAGALNIPNDIMGNILITDSINYTLWVMLLLALVPFGHRFNVWSNADTSAIDDVAKKLETNTQNEEISTASIFLLLGLSFFVNISSDLISSYLPTTKFLSHYTWIVLLSTLFGIIGAMTPLNKVAGSSIISSMMLYLLVALMASRADFSQMSQAPIYIIAGFTVLLVHFVSMIIFAKIFKLDLFSLGVSSLANIGGVASAPILASAYSKALVPIGVIMALMGYILGTAGGLTVGIILEAIAK